MYRAFKLNIEIKSDYQKYDYFNEFLSVGELIKDNQAKRMDDLLSLVTDETGIICAEELMEYWFPIEQNDVFISYSHNDQEAAIKLAGFLKQELKLNVFLDSLVWGSADKLLREIDDTYCIKPNNTYDYQKRNFSTSHVHSMLSTSILNAMDKSEIVIFLNSSNSTYTIKEGFTNKKHTLSPWIYQELVYVTTINKLPDRYIMHSINESTRSYYTRNELNIAYPITKGKLTSLTSMDLLNWKNKYREKKGVLHALDILYELIKDE